MKSTSVIKVSTMRNVDVLNEAITCYQLATKSTPFAVSKTNAKEGTGKSMKNVL